MTLCLVSEEISRFVLFAEDAEEPWRYPRPNYSLLGQHLAQDLEVVVEVMKVRLVLMREQIWMIQEHWWVVARHLWGVLYRVWRLLYHAGSMVDEVAAEIIAMMPKLVCAGLDLLECAREARSA